MGDYIVTSFSGEILGEQFYKRTTRGGEMDTLER